MKVLLLAAAVAAIAVPAAAQPSDPNCFFVRDIDGKSVGPDGETLYFSVMDKAHMTAQAYYRLKVTSSCHVIAGSTSKSVGAGVFSIEAQGQLGWPAAKICKMDDLRIAAGGPPCTVESFEKMTPAEVAALPRRTKP